MALSSNVKGITIELGYDTTKLGKALSEINKQISGTQKDLKEVQNLLKLDPTNTDLLAQKHELLARQVENTRTKLEALKKAQDEAQRALQNGELSQEEYRKLTNEIEKTKLELEALEKQAKESNTTLEKLGAIGDKLQNLGGKITDIGKKFAPISGAAAALGTTGVKSAMEFDAAMSQVAATMGKSTDELGGLADLARQLGADTAFSASEAADAINILAMAGLNEAEIFETAATTLDLAAAGQMSMAEAATFVTGAVKGYGDEMANSGKYADLMAKGATLANTDVTRLGEALSGSAANMHAYGQTVDTATVSLLRLAEQNITGSEAATMLNRTMSDLYTPTDSAAKALQALGISAYDENQQAKDLTVVMDELSAALADMSDEQRNATLNAIFTTNGLKGYNAMASSSTEKTQEFYDALAGAGGSASEQAATQLDNLQGQLTILKSGLQEAAIAIGEALMPVVRQIVAKIQEWVTWFNNLDEGTKEQIAKTIALTAAISPLLLIIGKVITVVGTVMSSFQALGTVFTFLAANPIVAIVAAIAGIVAVITTLWNHNEDFRNKVIEIWEGIKTGVGNAIEDLKTKITGLGQAFKDLVEKAKTWGRDLLQNFINGIQEKFSALKEKVMSIGETVADFIGFSEPEKGPLSNFHTFAPDMMDLFAQGITDNMYKITEAMQGLGTVMAGSIPGRTANISLTSPVYLDGKLLTSAVNEQLGFTL